MVKFKQLCQISYNKCYLSHIFYCVYIEKDFLLKSYVIICYAKNYILLFNQSSYPNMFCISSLIIHPPFPPNCSIIDSEYPASCIIHAWLCNPLENAGLGLRGLLQGIYMSTEGGFGKSQLQSFC